MNANETKHEARVAEWTERVRECRSSGMSVKAWRAEAGIKTARYYRWEREVLTKASESLAKRDANQEEAERKPKFVGLPEAGIKAGKACGKGRVVAEFAFMRERTRRLSGRCAGRRYAERLRRGGAYL